MRRASLFAPFTDRDIYRAMMDPDRTPFRLLTAITKSFLVNKVDFVVADAWEGFNPCHDICRFLVDEAMAVVRRETGLVIPNFSLPLSAHDLGRRPDSSRGDLCLTLSEEVFAMKLREAFAYREMEAEVTQALSAAQLGSLSRRMPDAGDGAQIYLCVRRAPL